MTEKGATGQKVIKMFCPSLSKTVPYTACDKQKLDLGSIARAFGLDPSTLKLNGHFISRGLDLISSSVTWRSLLSFFSSKGLSTGKDDKDALVVDGKLLKIGNKRGEEYPDSMNGGLFCGLKQGEESDACRQKKIKKSSEKEHPSSGGCTSNSLGVGLKRRKLLEDVNLLKKLKISDGSSSSDSERTKKDLFSSCRASSVLQFTCRYLNNNLKRVREEEVVAAPCKRTR